MVKARSYEFFDIDIDESESDITVHIVGGNKWMSYDYKYSLIEWNGYEDYLPQDVQIMRWLLYVASEMPNDTVARKVAEKAIEHYLA